MSQQTMDLKGKKVLVVGLGKSGIAAALFLQERGARVTVSDAKTQEQLRSEIPTLLDRGITVETGGHGERTFRGQDLIVVSPGVPTDSPQLVQARAEGSTILGEVELAARFIQGNIVAITGSNGKTTTTTLCGELLKTAGRKTVVGGNIGTPVISLLPECSGDCWVVLEVSSFQLETIHTFRPQIAAVLNVTPDHLDRHGTFEAYSAAKARIFENQQASDVAVLNADDATCRQMATNVKSQVRWFSRLHAVDAGAYVREGGIVSREQGAETEIMPVSEIPLAGAHNVENVLAAVCIARAAGCSSESIRQGVRDFKAVEHRLEWVARVGGVDYYNDSKATNVDATIKALESFGGNIHLILGGKDKGSDYSVLNALLRERVTRVYTIGAAAPKIEAQIAGATQVLSAGTLDRAVQRAASAAQSGDVVLLAPACASFDQFDSYEHRGRTFKQLVQQLQGAASVEPR